MPLYYFKLVDSRIVSDHGVHQLADEAAARKAAIELARSIRETRPDLVGQSCSVSVTDEYGAGICLVPLRAQKLPAPTLSQANGLSFN
jgi:hypothetical protein